MRNRKLIALLLCSLLLCMMLAVISSADVGNVDGGGWDDVDFGGDNDSDGMGNLLFWVIYLFRDQPAILIPLVIIIIVLMIIKARKKKNQGGRPEGNYEHSSNAIASMSETEVIGAVRRTDPDFAAEQFKTYSNDVFLKVQEAWEAKDLDTVRPYISDKLHDQLEMQLREFVSGKKTNHLDGQYIRSAELTNFVNDGSNEMIEVRISAQLIDYVTDDATGDVLNGSKSYRYERVYRLQFIRTAGQTTGTGEHVASTNCPCCGAPLEINQAGRCAYCDSVITSGVYGWILNDYNRW